MRGHRTNGLARSKSSGLSVVRPPAPSGDVSRLQRRAFGWRMGRQIAGDRNQDMPALVGIAPNSELSDDGRLTTIEHRSWSGRRTLDLGASSTNRVLKKSLRLRNRGGRRDFLPADAAHF